MPFIQDLLHADDQLFIALSETWLRDHKDAELHVEGYTIFRQDRQRSRLKRRGRDSGGVAFYIREDLAVNTEPVLQFTNGVVEILGIFVKTENLLLVNLYRQPDDAAGGHRSTSVEFKQALGKLRDTLQSFTSNIPDIIWCGDFNIPHANWPDGTSRPGASRDEKTMMSDLGDLTSEFFLTQWVDESTHRAGNILDLLFSNNPGFLHSYQCMKTVFSDHYIIECKTTFSVELTYQSDCPHSDTMWDTGFNQLNFFSDDIIWENLDKALNTYDWLAELRGVPLRHMLARFTDVCLAIAQEHVPMKKRAQISQNHKIPRDRRTLMRTRNRIKKQVLKTTSDARKRNLLQKAIEIEKKLKRSYDNDKDRDEQRAVSAIKKNSKYFYSYAKKFSKVNTGIGPLLDADKNIVSDPVQMAEILATQYKSVFSVPMEPMPDADIVFPTEEVTSPHIEEIYFDEEDIAEAIAEIRPASAAGPDGFPAILLKNCKEALSKPLYLIWRESLDFGRIPEILKSANIVPIHKGGNRGLPKQYRPVALTSHIIKVFEKVLRKHLVCFLEENNLLNPSQHGFRSGRSCLSQLITHFDEILRYLEEGHNVDVLYLDFAKAFDKVDFLITLRKMKKLGITGRVGRWIHSFLTGRTQTVSVKGRKSTPSIVESGVPQGSVLGPLLFLILIGDIDHAVASSFVSSFADDTRIGRVITSKEDADKLQADLESVYQWAIQNNMQFNCDKFECIRYGHDKDLQESTSYLSNTGTRIAENEHVRDLGVTISCDGTFKKHITNTIDSANNLCGWILRTFKTRQATPMLTLWKSMVLSKLDYCSQLWSPISKGDIQALESVQRSFIRKIEGVQHLGYWDQLKKLKLYSLQRRRERYMIIYVWRVLEGQVPNIGSAADDGLRSTDHIRRGRMCVVQPVSNRSTSAVKQQRYASLRIHGARLFNSLPSHIRNLTNCTVDVLKKVLDRHLTSIPDEPQIQSYTAQRRADSNSLLDMTVLADSSSSA